jgi:RNA-binding protein YlmH
MAGIAPVVTAHLMAVNRRPVKTKACGIVAMANVFQQAMFVMAQVNSVTLDGVLIAPMVQMKV